MRKRGSVNPLNLDPLVDTMTNVFGVLMFLVLGTHLVVADTATEFTAAGEAQREVTPEALQEAEKEADRIEKLLNQHRERWSRVEQESSERKVTLVRLRESIERLKKELHDPAKTALDENALKRLIMERQKSATALERKIGLFEEEIRKLLAQQEEHQSGARDKPLIARLPNPRPAPKGSSPEIFFCRYGRIAYLDVADLFNRQVTAVLNALRVDRPVPIKASDYPKMINYFDNNIVGTEDFHWKIALEDDVLTQEIKWRHQGVGETLEQIQSPDSAFQRKLRALNEQEQWIIFFVWSDCFDVYPAAREIAAERGFSAGWNAFDISKKFILPFFLSSESADLGEDVLD